MLDAIYEVAQFRDPERLRYVSVQRFQLSFGEVSNACFCLVLSINRHKSFGSLNRFDFPPSPILVLDNSPCTSFRSQTRKVRGDKSHCSSFPTRLEVVALSLISFAQFARCP
jgi:hypothetical protein